MNIFLAPIQSMTMDYYRTIHAELFSGVDKYYAPFITTTDRQKYSILLFKDIYPDNNDLSTVIPQLLSNNGSDFNDFAKTIVDMGYSEINWNIGCPFSMVTRKIRGSGILPHPDLIKKLLDEVCRDMPYDLTVKMRLGMSSLNEGIEVVKLLNDYPIKSVMIHGRTASQKYEGTVDLDAFETLYKLCKHDVTYNGDIFTVDDYNRVNKRFPSIKNYMIGRGLLSDPLLAAKIKGQHFSDKEIRENVMLFHDTLFTFFNHKFKKDSVLCGKMKEFWSYMSYVFEDDGVYFEQIKRCQDSNDYLRIVYDMLNAYEKRST